MDCELSSWGSWSSCEPFCDGTQERRREVLRAPQNGSKSCMAMVEGNVSGVTRERRPCSNWCGSVMVFQCFSMFFMHFHGFSRLLRWF